MVEGKAHEAEKKLCLMEDTGKGGSTSQIYRMLVKDPQYVCKGCGREARNEDNLCAPEKM